MNAPPIREFRLLPVGARHGVSCDASGAFIDAIPLLKRSISTGRESWEPRPSGELSADLSAHYGLPIELGAKFKGVCAIARALTAGEVARAQLIALHLRIPETPDITKSICPNDDCVKFIGNLHWSGLLKYIFVPEEHPRWPSGAPDSQGGQFAPKDAGIGEDQFSSRIEIASNVHDGPVCREVAAAGCIAGITATAPEGAAAACTVTGPACPVGAAVGGATTAIGSCIAGGIIGYEACRTTNPSKPAGSSNPDRPSDRAIKDQCIAICSPLLERPERAGKGGTNQWDFHNCLNEWEVSA
jgi:hypothetical protein